ncbi:hypothetical protein DPMN_122810 [Dreissena polymorpha]|uniref:Uncharacterized protein n=1 Tax=Dreissena polymorpha TaxID=45954 RepID=A0A9D4GSJ3_DREPO|nr:hypothetical protein DPMN_122810 [Dreissena polymorpha]
MFRLQSRSHCFEATNTSQKWPLAALKATSGSNSQMLARTYSYIKKCNYEQDGGHNQYFNINLENTKPEAKTSSGNRAATSSQKSHLNTKNNLAATKRQLVAATEPQLVARAEQELAVATKPELVAATEPQLLLLSRNIAATEPLIVAAGPKDS